MPIPFLLLLHLFPIIFKVGVAFSDSASSQRLVHCFCLSPSRLRKHYLSTSVLVSIFDLFYQFLFHLFSLHAQTIPTFTISLIFSFITLPFLVTTHFFGMYLFVMYIQKRRKKEKQGCHLT
uniref:Uncharacterized protein n=1 Tax=Cacopsylla melanoneura TaxID=428564 RepID=A0A8D8VTU7_9HEMI